MCKCKCDKWDNLDKCEKEWQNNCLSNLKLIVNFGVILSSGYVIQKPCFFSAVNMMLIVLLQGTICWYSLAPIWVSIFAEYFQTWLHSIGSWCWLFNWTWGYSNLVEFNQSLKTYGLLSILYVPQLSILVWQDYKKSMHSLWQNTKFWFLRNIWSTFSQLNAKIITQ